jgi:hypothetical protein
MSDYYEKREALEVRLRAICDEDPFLFQEVYISIDSYCDSKVEEAHKKALADSEAVIQRVIDTAKAVVASCTNCQNGIHDYHSHPYRFAYPAPLSPEMIAHEDACEAMQEHVEHTSFYLHGSIKDIADMSASDEKWISSSGTC